MRNSFSILKDIKPKNTISKFQLVILRKDKLVYVNNQQARSLSITSNTLQTNQNLILHNTCKYASKLTQIAALHESAKKNPFNYEMVNKIVKTSEDFYRKNKIYSDVLKENSKVRNDRIIHQDSSPDIQLLKAKLCKNLISNSRLKICEIVLHIRVQEIRKILKKSNSLKNFSSTSAIQEISKNNSISEAIQPIRECKGNDLEKTVVDNEYDITTKLILDFPENDEIVQFVARATKNKNGISQIITQFGIVDTHIKATANSLVVNIIRVHPPIPKPISQEAIDILSMARKKSNIQPFLENDISISPALENSTLPLSPVLQYLTIYQQNMNNIYNRYIKSGRIEASKSILNLINDIKDAKKEELREEFRSRALIRKKLYDEKSRIVELNERYTKPIDMSQLSEELELFNSKEK